MGGSLRSWKITTYNSSARSEVIKVCLSQITASLRLTSRPLPGRFQAFLRPKHLRLEVKRSRLHVILEQGVVLLHHVLPWRSLNHPKDLPRLVLRHRLAHLVRHVLHRLLRHACLARIHDSLSICLRHGPQNHARPHHDQIREQSGSHLSLAHEPREFLTTRPKPAPPRALHLCTIASQPNNNHPSYRKTQNPESNCSYARNKNNHHRRSIWTPITRPNRPRVANTLHSVLRAAPNAIQWRGFTWTWIIRWGGRFDDLDMTRRFSFVFYFILRAALVKAWCTRKLVF